MEKRKVKKMTNEFLDAAESSGSQDSSSDRYEKLKKEEAGTERNEAEERFDEIKEKAKKEFIEKQKQRDKEKEKEERRDSNYVTY